MKEQTQRAGRRPASLRSRSARGKAAARRFISARLFPAEAPRERGQIIILLAMALTGLLIATGLAVDGGMLLLRKAQLDRAVDAAALAGVVEVKADETLGRANTRGQQLMAANNVLTSSPAACADGACECAAVDLRPPAATDYCGQARQGSLPGSVRYYVRARWSAETYFMSLIGFDRIPLYSEAEAEYMPLVDIYASDINGYGLVKLSTQSIFGPRQVRRYGDPYSVLHDSTLGSTNPEWDELYGVYTYRIRIPEGYDSEYDRVRVELLDPDTGNRPGRPSMVYGVDSTANWAGNCRLGDASLTANRWEDNCLIETPFNATSQWPGMKPAENPNRFWFVRLDEHRAFNNATEPVVNADLMANLTETLFRLYYMRQNPDGSVEEVDLAYYVGKRNNNTPGEGLDTDLMWVSPYAPDGERMPAMNVFDELQVIAGMVGATPPPDPAWFGTTNPAPDYSSPEEPSIPLISCEAFRAANSGKFSADPSYADGHWSLAQDCSGNGDFIIDVGGADSEVPNIMTDPNGVTDIYLQVRSLNGSSENGYEIWAGPPYSAGREWQAPAEVNARQLYLWNLQKMGAEKDNLMFWRRSPVIVTGLGRLPMNGMTEGLVDIPLAYLGPEFTSEEMTIRMFDPDAGAQDPIIFTFDTIPEIDWNYCYDDRDPYLWHQWGRCGENVGGWNLVDYPYRGMANIYKTPPTYTNTANGMWSRFEMVLPSEEDTSNPTPFYGGRLYARYKPGLGDTYVWSIEIDSRPYLVR